MRLSYTLCNPCLCILLFLLYYRKKSSRTITYDEFKAALGELARKKYKEKPGEEAEAEVFKLIEGKSPVISGVTVRFDQKDSQVSQHFSFKQHLKLSSFFFW